MGSEAVAAVSTPVLSAPARGASTEGSDPRLTSLRKQLGYGRRFRPSRGHLVLIAVAVVAFWVILGFARTITQLNSATDRQSVLTAETQNLSAQLDAGHRELELVQTDGFQALQARSYGLGAPGEIAFSLEAGAPPPPTVVPLGGVGNGRDSATPLDAWLRLLFGD